MIAPQTYKAVVDRRLIPLVLMIPAGLAVAILAKALGLGHEGRLWLSVGLLGPAACVGTIYALQLRPKHPGPSPDDDYGRGISSHGAAKEPPDLMKALEAALEVVREDPHEAEAIQKLALEVSRAQRNIAAEHIRAWHSATSSLIGRVIDLQRSAQVGSAPQRSANPQAADSELVAEVARHLQDPSDVVRAAAALALGNLGATGEQDKLLAMLKDAAPLARSRAAWALGSLGGAESLDALRDALSHEPDVAARAAILDAVGVLGTGDPTEHALSGADVSSDEPADLARLSRGADALLLQLFNTDEMHERLLQELDEALSQILSAADAAAKREGQATQQRSVPTLTTVQSEVDAMSLSELAEEASAWLASLQTEAPKGFTRWVILDVTVSLKRLLEEMDELVTGEVPEGDARSLRVRERLRGFVLRMRAQNAGRPPRLETQG